MRTTLDEQGLFDEQGLTIEVGSLEKVSIDKAVSGLDGVLSIDLGGRGRRITQKGTLRANSRLKMNERIGVISAYMDGRTHKLAISDGREFSNLRMDIFKVTKTTESGIGLCCEYEIVYRQLV
ncbi:MAG: hypothetical protein NTW55_08050 [Planctomycetota bacterium]|nr:hypothetical protein [Planctomycetota bacterium]